MNKPIAGLAGTDRVAQMFHDHPGRAPWPVGLPMSGLLRAGVIALALMVASLAGISILVYRSPYSPLILMGVVAISLALVAGLGRPQWILYIALFSVLLPTGLIPPQINSYLNRAATVAALCVWLFDAITRRRRIVLTLSAVLMLGFLVWSTATLLWARYLTNGTNTLQTYALRLLLFFVLIPNTIRRKGDLQGLTSTLAISGWVVILSALLTVLQKGYAPGTRFTVLNENANGVGILLLVALPGVLWGASQGARPWGGLRRASAVVYIMLSILVVAMSGSRGSAISLLAVLACFLLWKPTRVWGVAGLLILALAALGASFVFATVVSRLLVERGDTLLGGREVLWRAAWMTISEHPWQGVGIGGAPYAIKGYVEQMRSIYGADATYVHNPLLTIWTETGIPGLILYAGVLVTAVVQFVRHWRRMRPVQAHYLAPYGAIVASVFVGYMLSWIKGGGMESAFSYFLMLSLLLVPSHLSEAPERAATPYPAEEPIRDGGWHEKA